MNKNQMEFLLSQELNEVKGGLTTSCHCYSGAEQGSGGDPGCKCATAAEQASKDPDEEDKCSCESGALQG
ncbi:MAG: hypothetical protein HDR74_01200 [Bacteroides sp.]|nr:hypothetical protein [Bacteroides sp.]